MQTTIDQRIDLIDHDAAVVPAPDLSWLPGFSEADLEQNALGRLSHDQRQELLGDLRNSLLVTALAAGLMMAPGMVSGHLVSAFIFGGLTAAVGVHSSLKTLADLTSGNVAVAEGEARTEFVRGNDEPDHYWLYIDGLKLETDRRVHQAFPPGGPYGVYYLPVSEMVVSAKPLPGWRYIAPSPKLAVPRRPWWKRFSIEL